MEAIETFEGPRGWKVEIVWDETPESPKAWDTFGTLVAFDSLWRNYEFANRCADSTEVRAVDNGGAGLLVRYLRMAHGIIAIPFFFADYGSSGARMWATGEDDENPSGFIYADKEDIQKEFNGDIEKARECLLAEIQAWSQYCEGDVYGYIVRDPEGNHSESCWGFYGREHVDEEAKEMLAACVRLDEDFRPEETEPVIERVSQ